MTASWEEKLEFLSRSSADPKAPSGRSLLDHLVKMHGLLKSWNSRPALCDAGLFHSIYSTELSHDPAIPLAEREAVRNLIGPEAEHLAWLFCVVESDSFNENIFRTKEFRVRDRFEGEMIKLTDQEWRDLLLLTFANALESLPDLSRRIRRNVRSYLDLLYPLVPLSARNTLDSLRPKWWQFWR